MSRSWSEIAAIIEQRRAARGPLLNAMMEVRERYNGDWVLPNLGTDTKPFTPTIIADAVDHNALRAASVMPNVIAPALKAGVELSAKRADRRRKAWLYTWEKSKLNLHLRRAYRHLFAYANTAFVIEPDFDHDCVVIKVRDPLFAFPEPRAAEDLSDIRNCGFIYGKSLDWLLHNFPTQAIAAGVTKQQHSRYDNDLWDICEWIDEDDIVLGVLGPRRSTGIVHADVRPFELTRGPNRAGRCTAVVPERVTLDKIASAVANATGIADLQAHLQHLHVVALEKSIVPDTYIVGDSSRPPRVVGQWKDGRTGEVNELLDVQQIGQLRQEPSQTSMQMIDRLERVARANTGTVSPFLGESFGGARTGRGLDALMQAAVDPRIQEAQEIMESALTTANRIVADSYVGYFPSKRYTVFSGWVSDPEMVEFTPGTDFETNENKVVYPIPGTDIVSLNIVLGQLQGTETIATETARRMHPYVSDPDGEGRRVVAEKLQRALETQILMRAQDPMGGLTPIDLAYMAKLVEQGTPLADAVEKADEQARARQAAEAAVPPEGGLPPEMMPGLANPGEGAESQPAPAIGPPPSGLANLDSLLGALSAPIGEMP